MGLMAEAGPLCPRASPDAALRYTVESQSQVSGAYKNTPFTFSEKTHYFLNKHSTFLDDFEN